MQLCRCFHTIIFGTLSCPAFFLFDRFLIIPCSVFTLTQILFGRSIEESADSGQGEIQFGFVRIACIFDEGIDVSSKVGRSPSCRFDDELVQSFYSTSWLFPEKTAVLVLESVIKTTVRKQVIFSMNNDLILLNADELIQWYFSDTESSFSFWEKEFNEWFWTMIHWDIRR